jgi:hypothetical protein
LQEKDFNTDINWGSQKLERFVLSLGNAADANEEQTHFNVSDTCKV